MAVSKNKQKRVKMQRRQKWKARNKRIRARIQEIKKTKKAS